MHLFFQFLLYSSYSFLVPENAAGVVNLGFVSPPIAVDVARRCQKSAQVSCVLVGDNEKGRNFSGTFSGFSGTLTTFRELFLFPLFASWNNTGGSRTLEN
jgi:hypothetical protein